MTNNVAKQFISLATLAFLFALCSTAPALGNYVDPSVTEQGAEFWVDVFSHLIHHDDDDTPSYHGHKKLSTGEMTRIISNMNSKTMHGGTTIIFKRKPDHNSNEPDDVALDVFVLVPSDMAIEGHYTPFDATLYGQSNNGDISPIGTVSGRFTGHNESTFAKPGAPWNGSWDAVEFNGTVHISRSAPLVQSLKLQSYTTAVMLNMHEDQNLENGKDFFSDEKITAEKRGHNFASTLPPDLQ